MRRKQEFIENENELSYQNEKISRILKDKPVTLYDEAGNPFSFASVLVIGKHFTKTYRKDLFRLLGVIGNSEIKILMYILHNVTYENYRMETANTFCATYDEIVAATGCSRRTVASVLKKLKDCNAIVKVSGSKYRVNPNLVSVGTELQQQRIMIQYNTEWISEAENENN